MGVEPRKRWHKVVKVKEEDKKQIKKLFEQGKTAREISELLGFNLLTVRDHLYKMGYNEKTN